MRTALDFLENSTSKVGAWLDKKFGSGLVASFAYCNEQLNEFRSKQLGQVHDALPHAFIKRVKHATAFMRQMERLFDLSSADLKGMFALLTKLKNFDAAKDLFDHEINMLKYIFELLMERLKGYRVGTNDDELKPSLDRTFVHKYVKVATIDNVSAFGRAYNTAEMLFKQCMSVHSALLASVSRCRSLLGVQLLQIRREMILDRDTLIRSIDKQLSMLKDYQQLLVPNDYQSGTGSTGGSPNRKFSAIGKLFELYVSSLNFMFSS